MEFPTDSMSPDDLNALIEFAGPVFMQAKVIDSHGMRDEYGNMPKPMSNEIVQSLELTVQKAKQKIRETLPPPVPQYAPPAASNIPLPVYQAPPQLAAPIPQQVAPQDQLEFKFDDNKQERTNTLLEEISRKLTKVISLLESNQPKQDAKYTHTKKEEVTKLVK